MTFSDNKESSGDLNDKKILSVLNKIAKSKEFKEQKKKIGLGPHPSPEMLFDYVLHWLNKEKAQQVTNHVAYCGACAREVLQIIDIEEESNEELLEWAEIKRFSEQIKDIWEKIKENLETIIPITPPVLSPVLIATRGGSRGTRGLKNNEYLIGTKLVIKTPELPSDSYMLVIHEDNYGKQSLVFPNINQKDSFVLRNTTINISVTLTGPVGEDKLIFISIREPLIYFSKINFEDVEKINKTIEEILERIKGQQEILIQEPIIIHFKIIELNRNSKPR